MSDGEGASWENAGFAALRSKNPTLKPLAELLRGNDPVPRGIRDMLAQMMDPDAPAYLYMKLEVVSTENKRKNMENDQFKMEVVTAYNKRCREGMSSQEAAEVVGKDYLITDRQVYRYKKDVEEFFQWLKSEEQH